MKVCDSIMWSQWDPGWQVLRLKFSNLPWQFQTYSHLEHLNYIFTYLCVYVRAYVYMPHHIHGDWRSTSGSQFSHVLCGSQESNSDSQAWQQPWSSFLIIKMKECILSHWKPSSSLVLCQYLSLGWVPDDHISSEISVSGDRWSYPNVNETMITMCLILNSCWILLLIMKTKLLLLYSDQL